MEQRQHIAHSFFGPLGIAAQEELGQFDQYEPTIIEGFFVTVVDADGFAGSRRLPANAEAG